MDTSLYLRYLEDYERESDRRLREFKNILSACIAAKDEKIDYLRDSLENYRELVVITDELIDNSGFLFDAQRALELRGVFLDTAVISEVLQAALHCTIRD